MLNKAFIYIYKYVPCLKHSTYCALRPLLIHVIWRAQSFADGSSSANCSYDVVEGWGVWTFWIELTVILSMKMTKWYGPRSNDCDLVCPSQLLSSILQFRLESFLFIPTSSFTCLPLSTMDSNYLKYHNVNLNLTLYQDAMLKRVKMYSWKSGSKESQCQPHWLCKQEGGKWLQQTLLATKSWNG